MGQHPAERHSLDRDHLGDRRSAEEYFAKPVASTICSASVHGVS